MSLTLLSSITLRNFSGLPRAVVLPGITRTMLLDLATPPSEIMVTLNMCTSDTIAELLRHLKRSYWPMPWDTAEGAKASDDDAAAPVPMLSHGGFRPAAKAACGEEMDAQLRAVSVVANWRLERGIWTSPGAGDIRRCRAACERLVLLGGPGADLER